METFGEPQAQSLLLAKTFVDFGDDGVGASASEEIATLPTDISQMPGLGKKHGAAARSFLSRSCGCASGTQDESGNLKPLKRHFYFWAPI